MSPAHTATPRLARVVDTVAETLVVPSFTRLGHDLRRRLEHWTTPDDGDVAGKVVLITGATSGIGRAAARQLARSGAHLIVVGRSRERTAATAAELAEMAPNAQVRPVAADLGHYDQVRALADEVSTNHDQLDVLIHNAGALSAERQVAPDGTEATVASQVVGPFLLTGLLLDRLSAAAPSRVLTMSSGGMYGAGLSVADLEMSPADYRGVEQYGPGQAGPGGPERGVGRALRPAGRALPRPSPRMGRHPGGR